MAYYSENFKKLELPTDELEFLCEGGTSNVFRFNDLIYKEYFDITPIRCTLKSDVYEALKTIDSKNMMKIYNIYSDKNLLMLYMNGLFRKTFQIKAYIAKYYEEDPTNIFTKSVDYFLDNCKRLDELAKTMTEASIVMYDVKRWNTILTRDNIVIIDPDYFSLTDADKEVTLFNNKEAILNLLHDIFAISILEFLPKTDLLQHFENCRIIDLHFKEFFDVQLTCDTDIAYELSKKLRHVKKPIDYFADKI